jgi:hypothetical protein
VDTPQPVKPIEPVRDAKDDDAAWDKNKKDYAPVELAYVLENQKWVNANKKCMVFNCVLNRRVHFRWGVFEKDKEPVHWLFKGVCYPAAQITGHGKVHRRCTWHQGAHPEDEQHGF